MIAIPNITKVLTKTRSRHQRVMQTGAGITLLSLLLASCGKVEVKELKPEQIAEYNKPGTVLIQANHKLEYSYAKPVFDAKTQSQLTQVVRQKVAQGEIKSEADAFAYAMRELLSHPLKYTLPGEKVEGQAEVPMVGTGFIVTPDGTVATAAHVVSNQGKKIKRELAKTALRQVTQGYCQQQMERLTREQRSQLEGRISPKEFMNICFDGFLEYYSQSLNINKVQTETSVVMQPANPKQGNAWKSIPSEIKKIGQSAPAEDVAILKIPGNNLPTVLLGDDKSVETGNEVYSLGYPGAVTRLFGKRDSQNQASKESSDLTQLPEPTLTAGGVSAARQSLPQGGQVIQANVAISPGNSGGPLFNKEGQVVGIASFVSVNEQGQQVQGASFFVPVEVLKRQLQEVSIVPQHSPIRERYQEAVDRFNQKQYRKSLQLFKDIRDTNPEFPYIQQQIAKAQAKSESEPSAIPWWAIVPIGTATLGIGTFVGIKTVTRVRARQAAKQAIESTLVEK